MMYNKKLVASVKSGGKIMREDGETVYLPFGSEYSLLLKNLNNRKALVKIEIDGRQVVDGGLIINPNETIDLERFVLDNMNEGPRFKFIEKTEEISDFRGDRIEDGIIRVEYQFEAEVVHVTPTIVYKYEPWDSGSRPVFYRGNTTVGKTTSTYTCDVQNTYFASGLNVGASIDGSSDNSFQKGEIYDGMATMDMDVSANDAGITVHGSQSNQKFVTGHIGVLEFDKHVICLNIKGQVGQAKVAKPVTVNRKITCPTCGKRNNTNVKFCGKCGTNLTYQY